MKIELNEELKLKIAKFIKGLPPKIANMVDLQPCLSLGDICNLVIKVEK